MEFNEILFCHTIFSNKVSAFHTKGIDAEKWLYLIAGIHGDESEGIYILKQLLEWMRNSLKNKLPVMVIPILNIDGYQGGTRLNIRSIDLNRNFPVAFKRQVSSPITAARMDKKSDGNTKESKPLSEAETFYLKKLLDQYPPNFLVSFHSCTNGKMITLGDSAKVVGEFLAKHNQYEIISDHNPMPGSLEAFIYDFYLSPVLTYKVAKSTNQKSYKDLWNENSEGLCLLLNGQAY